MAFPLNQMAANLAIVKFQKFFQFLISIFKATSAELLTTNATLLPDNVSAVNISLDVLATPRKVPTIVPPWIITPTRQNQRKTPFPLEMSSLVKQLMVVQSLGPEKALLRHMRTQTLVLLSKIWSHQDSITLLFVMKWKM